MEGSGTHGPGGWEAKMSEYDLDAFWTRIQDLQDADAAAQRRAAKRARKAKVSR